MLVKKKRKGIESLKSQYGVMFISHWVIGMLLFFIFPILQSVYYSFTSLEIKENGISTHFEKLSNYYNILVTDPEYLDNLLASFSSMLLSLPFILIVSMVMALLLNGKYKGRIFFRGLYFLPVIFASGAVLELFLKAGSINATSSAVSSSVAFDMINFGDVLKGLNLPSTVEKYISSALSNIFLLIWQSGIQTLLLIAGLQTIPDLLYEVAKVEGATKWEEFWFVTLPMLMRTVFLVVIFTAIELVSSANNDIMLKAYEQFNLMEYGVGSAMLWFYFLFVGIFIALIAFVYNKFFVKRWE